MCGSETAFWECVAEDLGIEIVAPFEAPLPDGSHIKFSALVKGFGAKNGMLVGADYAIIKPHAGRLLDSGYGYCAVLGGGTANTYERDSMIEVFADWGWSGPSDRRPTWLP
jgi:hypothetical protein